MWQLQVTIILSNASPCQKPWCQHCPFVPLNSIKCTLHLQASLSPHAKKMNNVETWAYLTTMTWCSRANRSFCTTLAWVSLGLCPVLETQGCTEGVNQTLKHNYWQWLEIKISVRFYLTFSQNIIIKKNLKIILKLKTHQLPHKPANIKVQR